MSDPKTSAALPATTAATTLGNNQSAETSNTTNTTNANDEQPTATSSALEPEPVVAHAADASSKSAVDGELHLEKPNIAVAAAGTATLNESSTVSNGTPPTSLDIDTSQPKDFDGELSTNNAIPSAKTLKNIENYIVLDRHGKSSTFKSLYSGPNVARRVLIIFVRHFFCGNCQEYLRTLSESITPEALLRLPVSTFIAVVGCGDPALIEMYARETNCPFPIYTDPKRSLFDALDMVKTLALGAKPAYMKKGMLKSSIDSIGQALRNVTTGLVLKSGDQRQVGGEFLFEPVDIVTPITTPQDEQHKKIGSLEQTANTGLGSEGEGSLVEEKQVTWCHRMKNTRDHAEIPELMEILGLDGQGQPIKDKKLWSNALGSRKGTGLSLASQMSQLGKTQQPTQGEDNAAKV